MDKWSKYYEYTAGLRPYPATNDAVELLLRQHPRQLPSELQVLELGPGAGRDTNLLVSRGLGVTAIDSEELPLHKGEPNLRIIQSHFEHFDFETSKYDLVSAQYSLPFMKRDVFFKIFEKIEATLAQGGIISCNLFGINDGWRDREDMTFLTRQEIERLLEGLCIERLEETERDAPTALGPLKHWHIFDVLAIKK